MTPGIGAHLVRWQEHGAGPHGEALGSVGAALPSARGLAAFPIRSRDDEPRRLASGRAK